MQRDIPDDCVHSRGEPRALSQVTDTWQQLWMRVQWLAMATGFLDGRALVLQQSLDTEVQAVLVKQAETQRLRRMLFHALSVATVCPGMCGVGCVVADPSADAAHCATPRVEGLNASPVVSQLIAVEGNPAAVAGVRVGDEVVAVDGRSTAHMPAGLLMMALQGPSGTPCRLTLRRRSAGAEGGQTTQQRLVGGWGGGVRGRELGGEGGSAGSATFELVLYRPMDALVDAATERGGGKGWLEEAREERRAEAARKLLQDVRMQVPRLFVYDVCACVYMYVYLSIYLSLYL